MANQDQLKLLKQGVQAWNAWRQEYPEENIDLQDANLERAYLGGANLQYADLQSAYLWNAGLWDANLESANLKGADLWDANLPGANLSGANLQSANLRKTDLQYANLRETDLQSTNLQNANLGRADLQSTNLESANLRGAYLNDVRMESANLRGADLRNAKLKGANLRGANLRDADLRDAYLQHTDLRFANLEGANLTGVKLFAVAKDQWEIEAVRCKYVFLDEEGKECFPKDRDFRPGEFEELYKQLPTFEYVFEHGFTPLDAVVMDRIVRAINEQHPEFELKLDSLQSRGQPHATFSVLHQKDVEIAKAQVATAYERRIIELEAQKDQLMEVIKMLGSGGITIQTVGRDVTITQVGHDIVGGSEDQR